MIYDINSITGTLCAREYRFPKVAMIEVANLNHYNNDQTNRVYSIEGIAPTLKVVTGGGREIKVLDKGIFRKLTPKEYLRLMGFSDYDYDILIENKISKTQIYKMAGNSIVVDVLEGIFNQLINYKLLYP